MSEVGGAEFGFLPVCTSLLHGAVLHRVLFPIRINDIDPSMYVGLIQLVLIQLVWMIKCYAVLLILFRIYNFC